MKFYGSNADFIRDLQKESSARVKAETLSSRNVENPYEAGSIYQQLFEANPYKDLYYDPTFWDNIGLSSKARDTNSQYQQLYNEYIANIAKMKSENEYNSPANQAALNKEAGLNPDLVGISDVGQMSGGNFQGALPSSLDGKSPAMDAISSITSVLGFATSTLQQIQTIKGLSEDNILKGLTSFDKFTELARPHIVNEYANRFSTGYSNNWSDVMKVSSNSLGLSRRNSKRYEKAFNSLLSSSRFTASEEAYKNLSANDRSMYDYINEWGKLSSEFTKFDLTSKTGKAKADKFLTEWRKEFNEVMYNDFKKHGSLLAGLILLGHNASYPGMMAQATYGVNKSVERGIDGFSNFITKFAQNFKY